MPLSSDDYLDQVVHNLTHRRFKDTSRRSVYELGSAVSNSFFDPRNVGNLESGEIAPEGKYLTHYPVNVAANTAGFSIMDDEGDDRRSYYPSQVFSSGNALVRKKGSKMSGGSTGSSSGSASDYIYFNPYYEALLDPQSKTTMEEIAQPHYIPRNTLDERAISGRGTNAPSSASAIDYAMNNPYAFKSNFNGGALGASSSGSASDYYDSNPNRVPRLQSETRHYTDFMEGGEINWGKYLGYIKKGAETVIKHAPKIIEHAPKIIEGVKTAQAIYNDVKGKKGALNKIGAVIENAPKVYKGAKEAYDTVRELRDVVRQRKRTPAQQIEDKAQDVADEGDEEDEFTTISRRKEPLAIEAAPPKAKKAKKSTKSKSKKGKKSRK